MPLISVCIPVFSTEPFLAQCLWSVMQQDFEDFEIVVVSDASTGRDEKNRTAKKIVKDCQKQGNIWRREQGLPPVKINFVVHKENRGLIEVRRSLMYEARGYYMSQVDSDDQMAPGALSSLFKASGCNPQNIQENPGIDIVHGTSTAGVFDQQGNFTPSKNNRYGKIFYGKIEGHQVFHKWLIDNEFTANTWGKLIKRELWQKAYEKIPYTECNMADDVLLFFFLSQEAKSYLGIEDKVYLYRVNSGMSSTRKIDTLQKWKMICSTSSVFSVLSTWISENPDKLQTDEVDNIRKRTTFYLVNNLKQMNEVVIPELKDQAHQMLCDYWGESFVTRIEKALKKEADKQN